MQEESQNNIELEDEHSSRIVDVQIGSCDCTTEPCAGPLNECLTPSRTSLACAMHARVCLPPDPNFLTREI